MMSDPDVAEPVDEDPDRPLPMNWDQYQAESGSTLHALLDGLASEAELQRFLERNPPWLVGAHEMRGLGGHHTPLFYAVISQPALQGLGRRIPDFLHLSAMSATFTPVFTEIESPAKKWFNLDGSPTATLAQARNQLDEWRDWLDNPGNRAVLLDTLRVPNGLRRRAFRPVFRLIYGRRSEFDPGGRHAGSGRAEELNARRATMAGPQQELRTWDSLVPDPLSSNLITCEVRNGAYVAKAVAPTFGTGARTMRYIREISGLEHAISANDRMTPARKAYLASRLDVWSRELDKSITGPRAYRPAVE